MLPITAITPFTLQDFPDHTACIIWFGGCNFRCKYCHNPEFVIEKFDVIDEKEVWDFLKKRKGLLEGVVLSGGECTMSNEIVDFVRKIKKMGFKAKIDTNGLLPDVVKKLVSEKLVDFIALDYKAPKGKLRNVSPIGDFSKFEKTLDYLISQDFPFEVRTTVHTDLLDEDDVNEIIRDLERRGYAQGDYYIQNFLNTKGKSIGNIGEQKRILNMSKIKKPKKFKVFPRNF